MIGKLFVIAAACTAAMLSFDSPEEPVKAADKHRKCDIMSDTWVATDALGRVMPTSADVGNPKTDKDRTVGIFYITWHTQNLKNYPKGFKNVTQVLEEDPSARIHGNAKAWTEKSVGMWHWGEPEYGYFLSQDKYVIRHDMSMLADAGVDVIILDLTNGVEYWDEWKVLFETMEEMKAEGNKVPKFCFWAFNGKVITVCQHLYDRIYRPGLHKDLWFCWEGKPLLLCNMNPGLDANGTGLRDTEYTDYSDEVKNFFTRRNMWWGYLEWGGQRYVGTEDNWSFGFEMEDFRVAALKPHELAAKHNGRFEEMAVTPAQHPMSITGKSWRRIIGEPAMNEYDMPKKAYVPWLGKEVEHPEGYGIYFQDRWDEALQVDPDFLYLNDWNEWTAGKYPHNEFMGRGNNDFFFVDQYNAEYNRTIQPMKGGYTDNYYMQMVQNIRRYKGVRDIPVNTGFKAIRIDGNFGDWNEVDVSYMDTRGDVVHRDSEGYSGIRYVNESGRNDIIESKVAVDKKFIHFYVKTADEISPYTDPNWMLLLIDADRKSDTGWFGYDFIINKEVRNSKKTVLMKWSASGNGWKTIGEVKYCCKANEMEIAIPRATLKLEDAEAFCFDFKWADNPQSLTDPISLCTDGDSAPNRRFNYRCIWKAGP